MAWNVGPVLPVGVMDGRTCKDSLGRIYVVGGTDGSGNPLDTVQRFDPDTSTWTELASMTDIRWQHQIVCLSNDHVVAIGGATGFPVAIAECEDYDPDTDTWTPIADLPAKLRFATAVRDEDDNIWVAGGYNDDLAGALAYSDTLYKFNGTSWDTMDSFDIGRFDHAMGIGNGKLVIAGGEADFQTEDSTRVYNIALDTWAAGPAMATFRRGMADLTDADGNVYLLAGNDSTYLATAERFNTDTETIESLPDMTFARGLHAAAMDAQGRVLVIGGTDNSGLPYLDSVERYDPELNAWESLEDMNYATFRVMAEFDGDDLHVIGGTIIDLSDFDPVELGTTYTEYINTPTPPGGGGGGDDMGQYTPQVWEDGEEGGTPLSAERLNILEQGVAGVLSPDLENSYLRYWDSASVVTITAGNQLGVTSMLDAESSTGDPSAWAEWDAGAGGVMLLEAGWYKTEAIIRMEGAAVGKYFSWGLQYFVPAGFGGNTSLDIQRRRTYFQGVGVSMQYIVHDVAYFPGPTGPADAQHSHILVGEVFNQATTDSDVEDIAIFVWKIG